VRFHTSTCTACLLSFRCPFLPISLCDLSLPLHQRSPCPFRLAITPPMTEAVTRAGAAPGLGQDRFLLAVRAWTGALRMEGGMQVLLCATLTRRRRSGSTRGRGSTAHAGLRRSQNPRALAC
jgi:hypothetical protein